MYLPVSPRCIASITLIFIKKKSGMELTFTHGHPTQTEKTKMRTATPVATRASKLHDLLNRHCRVNLVEGGRGHLGGTKYLPIILTELHSFF